MCFCEKSDEINLSTALEIQLTTYTQEQINYATSVHPSWPTNSHHLTVTAPSDSVRHTVMKVQRESRHLLAWHGRCDQDDCSSTHLDGLSCLCSSCCIRLGCSQPCIIRCQQGVEVPTGARDKKGRKDRFEPGLGRNSTANTSEHNHICMQASTILYSPLALGVRHDHCKIHTVMQHDSAEKHGATGHAHTSKLFES